jgi:hypothetical protein
MPLGAKLARPERFTQLNYGFLERVFLFMGIGLFVMGLFSKDPVAFTIGGMTPYLMVRIVGRPNMPVAVVYMLLWQWAQVFARVVQTLPDGESLGGGIFGPNVERAYWYMLSSVMVLALAMRATLGSLPEPTPQARSWHARWRPRDLVSVYVGTLMLAVVVRFSGLMSGALDQPLTAVLHLKSLALFLLFANVLTTGRGGGFMMWVVLFEIVNGFAGILADFKAVFFFLGLAALAVRIRWTVTMGIGSVVWGTVLIGLAIFWTGVKMDYRQLATGSDESQTVTASLSDRLGYLGSRAISPSSVDWSGSAYLLLIRFAYVDITGSVITVQEATPEPQAMRQWSDALAHVLQPRFLFPDKPALSDSDVYVRLAKGDPTEEVRAGTSISVGYIGENYADLGFPGMLLGIMVIGLGLGFVCRYFMTRRNLPWMLREGTVLVIIYSSVNTVEASLPKLLGAIIMVSIVFLIIVRFGYPRVLQWLDRPVGGGRRVVRRAQT